ncbi:hypothetical protein ADIWIN_1228 [Winogradskyella psychrotolerans RS-3]|jgi:hypothetical protein|uniref:Uncharacterized protein n=1 Tax=Winogradskyella psychrotolerans RS-3 TaxID=641526 RepID=S7VUQ3_9FLAO|nr:hypothetical protein [Winogradskyella psychrotolerans]EPR73766.1 hypothetical protein ADIWIN_1228 [Winogradskyella psychrotolerans RS-3]
MNPELKSLLAKGFKYFYGVTLLAFFVATLMLISYIGMKKDIDWNGALILYGILIPALLIFRFMSKKFEEKNVG